MTGGFVLGEVLVLHGGVEAALPAFSAVLLVWIFFLSVRRGRSLVLWLLPLFLAAGILRGGRAVSECERELALKLDRTRAEAAGTVEEINETDGRLELILRECVGRREDGDAEGDGDAGKHGDAGRDEDTEEGDNAWKLRGMQVYLDAGEAENDLGVRLRIGNRVCVSGDIAAFSEASNPGEFDFRNYYRSQKLNYRMFAERGEIVDGRYNWYLNGLHEAAARAAGILDAVAEPEDAGVYKAAILGDRAGLEPELRDLYQRSGIAHLLAISGLHLALVSAAVYGGLRKAGAGFGRAGLIGAAVLTSYAVMTGASPSVVRALIMAQCGFAAAYLGRTYDLLSALSLAALMILWDNPCQIMQSGVQLSFTAVAGFGGISPMVMRGLESGEKKSGALVRTIIPCICMQLVTLPVVLYHFFQIPPYGILLNLMVVPLMGGVIASGAAGILLGSFHIPLGKFAVGSGHVILALYEWLCRLCGNMAGSSLVLGRPGLRRILAYYVILAVVLVILGRRGNEWKGEKEGGGKPRILLIVASLIFMAALLLPPCVRGLQVTFLDVGQGDGICIRTGEGTILVDGGSSDEKALGKYRLEPFLKSQGITEIDYAFVTHGDLDHISGLQELLGENRDIRVRHLILPAAGQGDPACETLSALQQRSGGDTLWMKRGERLTFGELSLTCLYPGETLSVDAKEDRNETSLVLKADYRNFHMLLTGDMSGDGEEAVLSDEWACSRLSDTQILKIAHHGSRYSTGEEWLDEVSPRWAVVSYGKGNRYGHPSEETVNRIVSRGIELFETGKSGAVMLWTDGEAVRWDTFKGK